jgi:mannose-6-phosphate isomerase-like protein (cupin superfamily)
VKNTMPDVTIDMHSEREVVKRYVVGLNENGNSALLMDGVPNQQELKDWFWRATLWRTRETPADNSIPGDRSLDGGAARSPFPGGLLVRVEWVLPDHDPEMGQKVWDEINKVTGHIQVVSEKEKQRSPSMHSTNTLDVMTILSGEIHLILDEGEILLKPTDTVIVQGVNHGWSNCGTEPCLFTAVMIDAIPRQ